MVPIAWTSPKQWSGSEVLTSADMNAYVSDNNEYLYDNRPEATGWMNQGTPVSQSNQRIESGTRYIGYTTATYGTATVTFSTGFGTAPRVVACDNSAAMSLLATARSVGTGGFLLHGQVISGTITGSAYINWIAIGA